jgi:hypothetical protein
MTYGLKVRTTEDEWDAVEDENSVARIMRMAQRNAQRAIQGYQRACYLCGASGAGKTFVLNKAIEGSGLKVIRTIPKDYYDLIHAFDFSQGKIPLVFEECDHLFRSPRCLNLLKIATDAAGAQSVRVRIPPKKRSEDSTWRQFLSPHLWHLRSTATFLIGRCGRRNAYLTLRRCSTEKRQLS